MEQLTPNQKRIAWTQGKLVYKLRNIQQIIREHWLKASEKHLKYVLDCTRRLGKSTFLLLLETEFCLRYPRTRAGFYAPVKEGLKDYIEPIVEDVFNDCPEDLRPKLDSSMTLRFKNGSRVIFRGSNMKQYRVKRGNDLHLAAIDEARDVDDLDNLIDSVIIPSLFSGSGRLLISSTPADTDDHPLKAYRDEAERDGCLSHYTIYDAHDKDPDVFPMERIEFFKSETKDPIAWQREYMAQWVKDPSKAIVAEWEKRYIQHVERDEYFPYYHKYSALDSGVQHKTAGIFAYYDFLKAKLIIEDEFTLQGSEVRTDRIAQLIKQKEYDLGYQLLHDRKDDKYKALQIQEKVYRRIADNNNKILINDLNSIHGLDFIPTSKDELPAMINKLRLWVKDGRIIVSPRCSEIAGCLENAIWNKNKDDMEVSKVYGHFDALAALIYMVRNIDTVSNPIPKYFNKSWATHAIPPVPQMPNTSAYNLSRILNAKTVRQQARTDFVRGGRL